MEIQLLLPSEIKDKKEMLKSVKPSKGGAVGIPDKIITQNMLKASEKLDDFSKEWRKEYDFHLAQFQVDVNPNPDYNPEWVAVTCGLNPLKPVLSRPIARSVFPSTEFVEDNWNISGEFGVSASLGFGKLPIIEERLKGETKGEILLKFEYTPKIAIVDSGSSGSNFHWNFRKAKGKFPTGGLELKTVIMRPRKTKTIDAFFEIAIKFDRKGRPFGIGDDLARAAAKSSIQFSEGPF